MTRLLRRVREALAARSLRARHNDFDYACTFWWGDRHPDADDRRNRNFGGASASLRDRRCLVCRPYTDDESDDLLDPEPAFLNIAMEPRR